MHTTYSFSSMHDSLVEQIRWDQLDDRRFEQIIEDKETFDLEKEAFFQRYEKYLKNKYEKNKHFTHSKHLIDKLTVNQMENLADRCPKLAEDKTFIGCLFEKRFHFELDPENAQLFSEEERREHLERMYKAAAGHPQSFKSALLYELLENGLKLEIFDEKYFVEYLQNPLRLNALNRKNVKQSH